MNVTLPNGTVIQGVPEGTNKWTVAEMAIKKGLAKPEDFGQQSANPVEGMGGFEKFRAGWGKAVTDMGRGASQMVGLIDRADVQSSRERDAYLMATGAGKAGNIAGAVATTLPAAFIPGANTVAGATAIGAGMGLLQPSTSTGETFANIGLGGALGGGSVLAARGVSAAYRGGKAVLEPLFEGGQNQIARRTMQAFAGGSDEAARAAQNIDDYYLRQTIMGDAVPGVKPTAAELARNPGISQLERTIRNNPEYMTAVTNRLQGNREAIMGSVDDIAGTPFRMERAIEQRGRIAKPFYDAARQATVKPDDALVSLLGRPSMSKAWERASSLAREAGETIDPGTIIDSKTGEIIRSGSISGNALHYLKMAMDDLADNPAATGIAGNEARAIANTRTSLVNWIAKNIPEYDKGRQAYASLSKPINQMEIGTALRNKLQPALADYGATSRSRAAMYADALRGGDDFAASTLGRSSATMSAIMTPEQMTRLRAVADQLGRRAGADELGRAVGSNTGQNMVSQNVLRQLLGPLGLPESTIERAAGSTLLRTVMKPIQYVGSIGEQGVMNKLAEAALDPQVAQEMLRIGIDPMKIGVLMRNQQYLAPAIVSGAGAGQNSLYEQPPNVGRNAIAPALTTNALYETR